MRAPSSALVVDAAVLVAAARGRSSGAILEAARAAMLVTTDRVVYEARRRIELGLKRPELLPIVDALVAEITVVPVAALAPFLALSELALRDAVASPNGSDRTPTFSRWPGASMQTSGRQIATSLEPALPPGRHQT
jgi:hypothetical protein